MNNSREIKRLLVDLSQSISYLGDNTSILEHLKNQINVLEENGEIALNLKDLLKKIYIFNHELDKIKVNKNMLCNTIEDLGSSIK